MSAAAEMPAPNADGVWKGVGLEANAMSPECRARTALRQGGATITAFAGSSRRHAGLRP